MLNKKPSCQSLAIFAALALESSAFLAPSSPVFAADVTMDSEHTHDMSKGARTITTDGTTAWGGRSTDGSTTTDNIVTLDDSVAGTYQNVYGGWTEGNTTGDSTKNQLTIAEKANLMDSGVEIYGGYTDAKDGGRANENTVIIQRDVNGFVKGGFSPNQSADENTVRIGKVRVTGNVSGGEGIRTANKNEVHLTGTATFDKARHISLNGYDVSGSLAYRCVAAVDLYITACQNRRLRDRKLVFRAVASRAAVRIKAPRPAAVDILVYAGNAVIERYDVFLRRVAHEGESAPSHHDAESVRASRKGAIALELVAVVGDFLDSSAR